MDKYMRQWYEDTHGQTQVSVIDDEVSRCGKWGPVATCPFGTQAHLLMVAGEDEGKEPTPVVAVSDEAGLQAALARARQDEESRSRTAAAAAAALQEAAAAAAQTEEEAVVADATTQTDDQGGSPTSDGGYIPSPAYSRTSDEGDGQDPGCQADCKGCTNLGCPGYYSDVSDTKEETPSQRLRGTPKYPTMQRSSSKLLTSPVMRSN